MYEMFMGPFDQAIAWSTDNIVGVRRFLEKVWRLQEKVSDNKFDFNILLDGAIKKVGDDIEAMKFNTAVSSLMILANAYDAHKNFSKENYSILLILLAPFAPHVAEELWEKIGNKSSILKEKWPEYDISKTIVD